MITKPVPVKGLSVRIPITIPVKGRGFINRGFYLGPVARRGDGVYSSVSDVPYAMTFGNW